MPCHTQFITAVILLINGRLHSHRRLAQVPAVGAYSLFRQRSIMDGNVFRLAKRFGDARRLYMFLRKLRYGCHRWTTS